MKTSSKKSASRTAPLSFPMPLWLQGAVELFFTAFLSLLAVLLLLIAVWFAGGFENSREVLSLAALAGQIWQLIHGVPLDLDLPTHGTFEAISGTVSLIPLGLTLIPLGLCFQSGRRLARASYEGQFWVPTATGTLTYAAISFAISLFASDATVSTRPWQAALVPCWVVLLGVTAGGWFESRSLARMIGVNAAQWVSQFSQYSRWAGSYVWAVVRSSFVALLGLIAVGGLLFAATVFYNWNDVLALYQSLQAGAVGDTAITLMQFGFVPNFVLWAMAWSTGAGFSFGQGTIANLETTNLGALPALPILGAMPVAVDPWSYFVLVLPIFAGLTAGWWFFRAGENHFDEWLSLKIRFRWISWPLSTLCLALFIGLLAGIWTGILGWFSYGSLGLGRFTSIGPQPLFMGLMAALWVALGVVLGSILAPLIEKDNSRELDRFADRDPAAERQRVRSAKAEARAAKKAEKAALKEARRRRRTLGAPYIDGEVVATESDSELAIKQLLAEDQADEKSQEVKPSISLVPELEAEETEAEETEVKEAEVEKTQAESAEMPFNMQDRSPKTSADSPADSQDTKLAGSQTQDAEEAEPTKPKLSMGRVIRRPKSR